MLFSVVVPVRKDGKIDAIINSLNKINYPGEKVEIIVSYGNQPSAQRNRAVDVALGDIVYFFDNDSEAAPEIFNVVKKHFNDPKTAGVGGPNLTPFGDTFLQHCFGMGLASKFANGKVSARYYKAGEMRESNEAELILCNLCMKRDVYLKAGGLNEKIYPNEENELMNRLLESGYKLIYDPEAFIYRSRRKNFKAVIKQHLNYGRGRMEQTLIEGFNLSNISFFIPLFFLFYILSLPFLFNIFYYLPLGIYLMFAFGSSLGWTVETKKFPVFFLMPFIYLVMHISYAFGLIWGFYRQKVKHVEPIKPVIEVVKMKEFGTNKIY
ncbi:glycosyltransferase [Candidatus Desantisbacteria bacterium]|nr:glycosyltransferase [Candidatus Desantisbacteria bacterium]